MGDLVSDDGLHWSSYWARLAPKYRVARLDIGFSLASLNNFVHEAAHFNLALTHSANADVNQ